MSSILLGEIFRSRANLNSIVHLDKYAQIAEVC